MLIDAINRRPILIRVAISMLIGIGLSVVLPARLMHYAFIHGARVPLEGVIFSSSVGLIVSVPIILMGLGVWFFLTAYIARLIDGEEDEPNVDTRKRRFRRALGVVGSVAVILTLAAIVDQLPVGSIFDITSSNETYVGLLYFLPVMGLLWVAAYHPKLTTVTFIAVYLSGVFYLAQKNVMDAYPAILRDLGYGGGIPVDLVYKDGRLLEDVGLFLKTNQTIILFDPVQGNFIEANPDLVEQVSYQRGDDRVILPPIVEDRVSKFDMTSLRQ